jgi:predicted chitinase
MNFYYGVVENRDDPLKLGRCQVRIVGLHTHDKSQLPTIDLPWATPMQPVTSAALNGIGYSPTGPIEGTSVIVVFADEENQQPIMIGTVGGIPQSKSAAIADEESNGSVLVSAGGILTDSSGEPVVDGSGNPIQVGTSEAVSKPATDAPSTATAPKPDQNEQPTPNKPSDDILKQPITTKPPPRSTSNAAAAEQNIKHLLAACDKVGLTSKYAKCSILGICGGESGWLPVEEGYYYSSAESLAKIFRRTFPGGAAEAQPYAKWQGTREEFFRKIYSPQGNGSLVGHKDPDDGAKYFGRGFNQITGKALYTKLQNYLTTKNIKVDFVNNPKSLIDDPAVAALATAAFYALFVKHNQNDPGYFMAALKRTGADANGTGYPKKKKYYEYFLGAPVTVEPTNKPSVDDQKVYTKEEVKDLPPAKQAALLEDRSDAAIVGFKDPRGKYPLRNLVDEPDTNRLARGVIKDTAIEFKDSTRVKQIPIANDNDTWEQPLPPFGGTYPYSKVYESEAGHLFIMDDTPANENISLYHKQGSFIDIDANGTQVNKIVGDGYTIIDKNGSIYIGGRCILTVGNGVNILVQGSADIEVEGASVINLKNQADVNVAGNLNMTVGGDMKTKVAGNYTLEAANINNKTAGNLNVLADGNALITGSGSMQLQSDGNMRLDYSRGDFGNGAEKASVASTGLSTIELGEARPNQFGYLQTPVRPSPPVDLKFDVQEENEALVNNYIANPDQFKNPEAAKNGVKENYAGTPKDDGQGKSLKSDIVAGDIATFLQKQLELTRANFYWRETGMKGAPSNANILRIWSDLGYPKKGIFISDQTAWCAGFQNWVLKQCGYRYVQNTLAKSIYENPTKWNATKVDPKDAQPGDIVVWNFSHVNFVYQAVNGKFSFVGGNQGGKSTDNNPNEGDVTECWVSGGKPVWTPSRGGVLGIYRPSKT